MVWVKMCIVQQDRSCGCWFWLDGFVYYHRSSSSFWFGEMVLDHRNCLCCFWFHWCKLSLGSKHFYHKYISILVEIFTYNHFLPCFPLTCGLNFVLFANIISKVKDLLIKCVKIIFWIREQMIIHHQLTQSKAMKDFANNWCPLPIRAPAVHGNVHQQCFADVELCIQ